MHCVLLNHLLHLELGVRQGTRNRELRQEEDKVLCQKQMLAITGIRGVQVQS